MQGRGTLRGQPAAGSQRQWGVRSHAVCRPQAVTTALSSSRCKGGAQERAVCGGLFRGRVWEVVGVGVGIAWCRAGGGQCWDRGSSFPIAPKVPEGSRVLSKGGLVTTTPPHPSAPCPLVLAPPGLGEDDAPSTWRFSKPWHLADRALKAVSKELSLLQMGRQLAEGVVGRVDSEQE